MKISKKDRNLLIGFLGVLILLVVYCWVFQPLLEKADSLRAENTTLQAGVIELQSKVSNQGTYVSETQEMEEEINGILQLFPVQLKEEDAIVLTMTEEQLSPMEATTLTMDATELVVLDDDDTAADETEDDDYYEDTDTAPADVSADTTELALYRKPISMQFTADYDAVKNYVKTIALQTSRTKIVGFTASYDESTGLLSCVANLNMYFITGQDGKTYEEPAFSSVILGTQNPFGTYHVTEESGEEEGELEDSELAEDVEGLDSEYGAGMLVGNS